MALNPAPYGNTLKPCAVTIRHERERNRVRGVTRSLLRGGWNSPSPSLSVDFFLMAGKKAISYFSNRSSCIILNIHV